MKKSKKLVKAEELFNSISHGIGVLIALACLVLLVVFASIDGNVWEIVSFSIFGTTMIALYISSTLYHSSKNLRKKSKRNILDHSMIYVLIAGTYTPICLVTLHGTLGWVLFGIIWGVAVIGVIYKLFFYGGSVHERKISAWLYVGMGWIILIAIVPLIRNASSITLIFLLAGCLSYSSGIAFYLIKSIPFGHGIWHLTILGGTICHFFAFLFMVK
ncbi:MAG: hemolysin III family protein [Bacteroidales bacterium]|nr:hemolysin III family protein [Bacteroidales bacterium]